MPTPNALTRDILKWNEYHAILHMQNIPSLYKSYQFYNDNLLLLPMRIFLILIGYNLKLI